MAAGRLHWVWAATLDPFLPFAWINSYKPDASVDRAVFLLGEKPMSCSIDIPVSIRVRAILLLFLLVAVPLGSIVAQESQSDQIKQILKLESDWNDAHLRGDVETLDGLWAQELTVVVPDMPLFTKPDLMNMWETAKVNFTRYQTTDVQVHFVGQTAVVTGRLQRSRDFGGRVRDDDWLFTKTYALLDGEWKVVSYHASNRPVSIQ